MEDLAVNECGEKEARQIDVRTSSGDIDRIGVSAEFIVRRESDVSL